jgi:hypothetical protein
MERLKEEKTAEACQKQRKDNLASLSLLRGSLASYTGDKGKAAYLNRLRKIAMVEKMLLENPVFAEHGVVKTPVPFLYAADTDLIIRKGDIFMHRGMPYEAVSLNSKRREFVAKPLMKESTDRNAGSSIDEHIIMPVHGFDKENTFAWFTQPDRNERKMIRSINNEGFYRLSDKKFQERCYQCHLVCATYNDYELPIFTIRDDGKLDISENRYYYFRSCEGTEPLNPFSDEGAARIKTAAQKGIEADNRQDLEKYSNLFKNSIPELACLLDDYLK